jgi:hypothetical protein
MTPLKETSSAKFDLFEENHTAYKWRESIFKQTMPSFLLL